MTTTHRLHRTGLPPLEFSGRLLAEASSAQEHGWLRHRHHLLTLYQTAGGKAIVHVAYRSVPSRTNNSAEPGHDWAEVCEASAVPGVLAEYDPLEDITGGYPVLDPDHPKAQKWRLLQEQMESAIAAAYDQAVARLLEAAGYCERIE